MRRDRRWARYAPTPKQAPPERGIKMVAKPGATWWGQRWIEALQTVLRGDAARLARGRTYARAGRAHDLVVDQGRVSGRVTGSRATPYKITIALAQLSASDWTKAILAMAEKAQFAAELLAGRMPKEIEDAFRAAGTGLFPGARIDLVTTCSCPDWGDPCKHVAATHYILGEALDRDPFLLFELRGRTKAQVLDALQRARSGATEPGEETSRAKTPRKTAAKTARATTSGRLATKVDSVALAVPSVTLGKVEASAYDRARRPLPALHFSFDAPVAHGAVLRQLGALSSWSSTDSPAELLSPIVRRAAEEARRIAAMEEQPPAREEPREAKPAPPARRRRAASTTPDVARRPLR